MLIPRDQEEILERSKLRKKCHELSSGEGSSSSLETKHYRRTVPKQKLFVYKGDYRNKGHNHENLFWVQDPVKVVSVVGKLSTIDARCQGQSCSFRRGDYRNKGHNPEKLFWAQVPVKMFSVPWELMAVDEHG
jgi:hypothetical protein